MNVSCEVNVGNVCDFPERVNERVKRRELCSDFDCAAWKIANNK